MVLVDKSNIQTEKDEINTIKSGSNEALLKIIDLNQKLRVMTYEETFNSWVSVGLGAIVGGLYVARIIYNQNESILTNYIGIGTLIASIFIFISSFVFLKKNMDRMETKQAKKKHITSNNIFNYINFNY